MKPITTNSAVEFLIALLVAASVIAIVAKRFRLPYTVALVVGGLMLSWIRLPHLSPLVPGQRPDWLTPDIILFLFLPALVFEGSLKLQVLDLPLRRNHSFVGMNRMRKRKKSSPHPPKWSLHSIEENMGCCWLSGE